MLPMKESNATNEGKTTNNTTIMSNTMADIYPIYASPLKAKWQQVIQDAAAACEHDVDKWDIKFTLNEFEVEEDAALKTITLSGKEFNINWLKKYLWETFKTSFHKEFPEYRVSFIEKKK